MRPRRASAETSAEPPAAPPTAQPALGAPALTFSAVGGTAPPPFAPVAPPVPPDVPRVGVPVASCATPVVPKGDTHIFVLGVAAPVEPDGAGSFGAMAGAPVDALPVWPDIATPPTKASTQAHAAGQSVFAVQLVALGVQEPGKVAVVVHMSTGVGVPASALGDGAPVLAGGAVPEPELAEPPPDVTVPMPVPPEQEPMTLGAQVKPAPQSASASQGSCHLYTHVATLFVVQELGGGGGRSHFVFAGHAGAVPPEHS
jgi:hypothetical protein